MQYLFLYKLYFSISFFQLWVGKELQREYIWWLWAAYAWVLSEGQSLWPWKVLVNTLSMLMINFNDHFIPFYLLVQVIYFYTFVMHVWKLLLGIYLMFPSQTPHPKTFATLLANVRFSLPPRTLYYFPMMVSCLWTRAFHHYREKRGSAKPIKKHPELDRVLREEFRSLEDFRAKEKMDKAAAAAAAEGECSCSRVSRSNEREKEHIAVAHGSTSLRAN